MAPSRNALIARILAIAVAVAPGARAALWVSDGGDDGNPGTEEQPLRTIGRARDVARTLNREMSDDLTVFIAGSLHVSQPVEFGPEDCGTNGYSVIYTAAPGEHPVVSGGLRVAGWTPSDRARNLWSAPAPEGLADTRDLFVNGAPARRTRGRLLQGLAGNPSGAAAAAPEPKSRWRNPGDVLFDSAEPGAIWSERAGSQPLFVENAFELLGAPGEWYFDRTARRIYYTPRAGEEMAAADVEAAEAEALIAGRGTADRPLSGLVFKGIRFEYTTCPAPSPGGAAGSRPRESPGAAVRFTFAGAIQFLEDDFVHLGTPALDLGPGFEGGTIEGCFFGDISSTALRITGASQVRVSDCRFSYVATGHHDGGAISLSLSEDVAIEHTQIDHFPTAAIVTDKEHSDAYRTAMNAISPPMVGYDGKPQASVAPDAGVSAPFRSVLDEGLSPPSAPRPPTGVSAEPEDRFAYVTWDPPCLDGGSPVASYTVASSTGGAMTVAAAEFRSRGYVVFSGLENGRGVAFTVAASSGFGTSPPSMPTATVVPNRKRRLKPPPPPAAALITFTKEGARIEITPPAADGGSPVVAYSVTSAPAGPRVVVEGRDVIHPDGASPLVRMIIGFAQGPGTTFSVAAKNAAGEGKPAVAILRP